MTKKILITGGAGFIGYHLAKDLHEKGNNVTICDNLFRGKLDQALQDLINAGVQFKKIDLMNKDELAGLGTDYDQVYHLAAINGTRHFYEIPTKVLKADILTVMNILDWFVTLPDYKNKKLLFSSTTETFASTSSVTDVPIPTPENTPLCVADPFNLRWSYAGSKILGELFCIAYWKKLGVPMTIVRYANVYGPRMGYDHVMPEFMVRMMKKEDPFNIYGGDNTRTFCYITDAVRATQMVMDSDKTTGEILHLGTDQGEISMVDLAERMFEQFNWKPEKVEVHNAPEGSVKRRCPDVSKIKALTGFVAEVPLQEGLQKMWEWYKEHPEQK